MNKVFSVIVSGEVKIWNLILSLKSSEVRLIDIISGAVIERLVDVVVVVLVELHCVV
jgi:hypothetical protein